MSMVYLPDHVAKRLRETATRQRRVLSTVVEIMLDFEDQRYFEDQERKEKKENK